MGCFADCFGTLKGTNHPRRRPKKAGPSVNQAILASTALESKEHEPLDALQTIDVLKQSENQRLIDPPSESRDEEGKEKPNISGRKKVTFDLSVKVYSELPTEEVTEGWENRDEGGEKEAETTNDSHSQSDSSSSSLLSYPPNYRYQNSRDSDDEYEDDNDLDDFIEDADEGDDKDDEIWVQEESSESLFSLSVDSRKHNFAADIGETEVDSPIPNNFLSTDVSNAEYRNVLNPVENISQWKAVKARARVTSDYNQAKENIFKQVSSSTTIIEEPDFEPSKDCEKLKASRTKQLDQGITVDTSLSSWLVEAEGTPNSKNGSVSVGNSSPSGRTISFEDRPILGALTVEEIRQFSATSSPRKSPSRSPDDMPIIGTVGSYWSLTGQTTDSDSSSLSKRLLSRSPEDRRVNWNPIPFETRLEMALQKGTADA